MSKRVVSLLLTLLLALSVCIPVFATTVEPADQTDVSESAETEETAPAEEEPSVEEPAEEAPAEEAPAEEPEATSEEVDEISQDEIAPISTGDDYYVVWNGIDTLTFQHTKPVGKTDEVDYWGQEKTDSFLSPSVSNSGWHDPSIKNKVKKVVFDGTIGLYGRFMFNGFTELESVTAINDGGVTLDQGINDTDPNGNGMFKDCTSLKTVNFKLTTSGSYTTDLSAIFENCTSLVTIDLQNWDVKNVDDFSQFFGGCTSLESVNLTGWKTVKASDMDYFFAGCTSLTTITGVKDFDLSNVAAFVGFFQGCSSLTELDLTNWNTEHMTRTNSMFNHCPELRWIKVGNGFHLKDTENPNKQIHTDTTTGVWIKEGDDQNRRWRDEELITLFERGGAAGTYIWVHLLHYDLNGGDGTLPYDHDTIHYYDDIVPVDTPDNLTKSGTTFIGWSQDERKDTVTSAEGEEGVIKEGGFVTFGDHNITLYAVWAEDANGNGVPDYNEGVTITFDINGGDGSKDSNPAHRDTFTVNELPGDPLVMYLYWNLKWEKTWNKGDVPADHPALLVGWSASPVEGVILENDRDENGEKLSDLLIDNSKQKVPHDDTTYYAVYGADENNDHIPDFMENSVQVDYYANGGTRIDGKWVDKEKGIFYECGHHHVPFEEGVVLMDLDQGKAYVERDGATLIGWSETVVKNLVTSEDAEKAAKIVTEITMPPAGNKQVYAVWAEDVNNNDIPDYKEEKVTVTFNIGGGHGTGTDPEHSKTFTVEVLPGTEFNLPEYAELHWSEAWEKDGAAADFEAILAGWADHPINDVILEDDVNYQAAEHAELSLEMIRNLHVTITKDITFYAVYAADENGDDEPDYLEHANQVEYYANGGTRIGGDWLDDIEGLFYRCGHHHVVGEEVTLLLVERGKELVERDGAVLIGWSEKAVKNLVTSAAAENAAGIITTYTMRSRNSRVYAVWAIDENGNGIADYKETSEEPTPKPTPSTKPTPTPKPDYGIIPDVPWYQYQPEDDGEYVPGPDEVTNSGFPDVDPNAWYAGPVDWAAQSGVTAGYPDGNFHPDDTCTRAQIVTFLWKAAGTPMSVGSVSFSDVEQGSFYYDAAVWAANSGIIAGYPDGNFHPDDPCTRAQIVAMLYRFANSPAVSGESKFFDVDASAYYYNAAIWAEQNGIVAGYPDGGFHPDDVCTRAQIVTMLYNYIKG